jgi:hypothetical protein
MQATIDVPTPTLLTVSQVDAQRAAMDYVADHIDPTFEVVKGARYFHKPLGQEIWQFIIRCAHGPLDAIHVSAQTGAIIPLTSQQVRVVREKAVLLAARKEGELPVDEQGYVLGEYARRRASRYLGDQLSMFYEGTEPILVPGDLPVWQVTIVFKMYGIGPFTLGVLDIDAKTGEPISLTTEQIESIRERTRAIIRHQTPASAAS